MSKKDLADKNRCGERVSSQSTSRRKALKTALAGGAAMTAGAVPAKWVAPVVNSVVLPSHAATSQATGSWFGVFAEGDQGFYRNPVNQENLLYASANNAKQILGTVASNIADTLVQPAKAQTNLAQDYLCVTRTDNEGGILVEFQYFAEDAEYAYNYSTPGTLGSMVALTNICPDGPEFSVEFTERPDGSLDYSFTGEGPGTGNLPQASCNIPNKDCPPLRQDQ